MDERRKIIFRWLIGTPFIIGTVAFLLDGAPMLDAMYGALSLYVMELNLDRPENWLLFETARWTAPLATASGILYSFRRLFGKARHHIASRKDNSIAIYCDENCDFANTLASVLPNTIVSAKGSAGTELFCHAKKQVIMFDSEWESLDFYNDHLADFAKSEIYIRLDKADSFLLRESNVHFFNPHEITAQAYWKERNVLGLMKGRRLQAQIAIIGFDSLGQKLLTQALLHNVFLSDQHIVYHVFGNHSIYRNLHQDFEPLNSDQIVYHDRSWECELDLLRRMDRIVVAQENCSEIVQGLIYTCCGVEIDIYNPSNTDLSSFYNTPYLNSYGMSTRLFGAEAVEEGMLYHLAKEIHYQLEHPDRVGTSEEVEREVEQAWRKLDGFRRESYLAFIRYHALRKKLLQKLEAEGIALDDAELGEAEHVRWSRFYHLNHWRQGIPTGDEVNAFNERIVNCLVPYTQVSQEEKDRELARVRVVVEKAARYALPAETSKRGGLLSLAKGRKSNGAC